MVSRANRGADPRASQETQGACTLRLREAQSGPVPCSGARRQNKVLDEVSAENDKDHPPETCEVLTLEKYKT